MYFDFCVSKKWVYLPAASVTTVYKLYTEAGYQSRHRTIDPEKFICFYTMDGQGQVEVGEKAYTLTPNTLFFANTPISLLYRCDGERWNFWLVEFKTSELLFDPNRLYSLPFRTEYQDLLNSTLDSLKQGDAMLAAAFFQTLCCKMHRNLQASSHPADGQIFSQCVAYIEDHMDQFSVNRFCEDCSISPRTLQNIFHRAVGVSPYQYYQRLRAERSKEYLEETDLSVAQVASKLGYLNSGHFSRIFKGYFGKTPRRYRTDFHLTP